MNFQQWKTTKTNIRMKPVSIPQIILKKEETNENPSSKIKPLEVILISQPSFRTISSLITGKAGV
jgi:hypothetical protein